MYEKNDMAQVEPFIAPNRLTRIGSGEVSLIPEGNETVKSTFRYPNSQTISTQGSILPAVKKDHSLNQKLKKYNTV